MNTILNELKDYLKETFIKRVSGFIYSANFNINSKWDLHLCFYGYKKEVECIVDLLKEYNYDYITIRKEKAFDVNICDNTYYYLDIKADSKDDLYTKLSLLSII